jgi:hypothetical protein
LRIHVEAITERITPHNNIAILVNGINIESNIVDVDTRVNAYTFGRPGQDSLVDVDVDVVSHLNTPLMFRKPLTLQVLPVTAIDLPFNYSLAYEISRELTQ